MNLPIELVDKPADATVHDQVELQYDESVAESKHPGAMLGLIMGIYPLMMVTLILLLIGYAFFVHPVMMSPKNKTPAHEESVNSAQK